MSHTLTSPSDSSSGEVKAPDPPVIAALKRGDIQEAERLYEADPSGDYEIDMVHSLRLMELAVKRGKTFGYGAVAQDSPIWKGEQVVDRLMIAFKQARPPFSLCGISEKDLDLLYERVPDLIEYIRRQSTECRERALFGIDVPVLESLERHGLKVTKDEVIPTLLQKINTVDEAMIFMKRYSIELTDLLPELFQNESVEWLQQWCQALGGFTDEMKAHMIKNDILDRIDIDCALYLFREHDILLDGKTEAKTLSWFLYDELVRFDWGVSAYETAVESRKAVERFRSDLPEAEEYIQFIDTAVERGASGDHEAVERRRDYLLKLNSTLQRAGSSLCFSIVDEDSSLSDIRSKYVKEYDTVIREHLVLIPGEEDEEATRYLHKRFEKVILREE